MGGANDGPMMYVGVGSVGITDVGAGAMLTSNEGARVVAVVGLVVDDEGERVESWGGSMSVGPVVMVGYGACSRFGVVNVGDSVTDPRAGADAGVCVAASRVDGLGVDTGVIGFTDCFAVEDGPGVEVVAAEDGSDVRETGRSFI